MQVRKKIKAEKYAYISRRNRMWAHLRRVLSRRVGYQDIARLALFVQPMSDAALPIYTPHDR